MPYIFGIFILMIIVGWIWRKLSIRNAKKIQEFNEEFYTKKQKEYFKGVGKPKMYPEENKREHQWVEWYEDEQAKNN